MQSLWARVAQVRGSCRCPQCIHAAQAVSRRAGSSANAYVRPRYWTSSTLWYSGIFAAAASYDASIKMRRREQWDQAIAEVQQELNSEIDADEKLGQRGTLSRKEQNVLRTTEKTEQFDSGNASLEMANGDDKEETLGRSAFLPLGTTDDANEDVRINLDSTLHRQSKPIWPFNTGPDPNPYHLPPQSIYALNSFKKKASVRKWTEKKLKNVELSVDILIVKFLKWIKQESKRPGLEDFAQDAMKAVDPEFAQRLTWTEGVIQKALLQKVSDARLMRTVPAEGPGMPWSFERSSEDIRLCNYAQDDLGNFQNIQRELNSTLKDLFSQGERGLLSPAQYLTKVFYNLAVSSAPPNVDTYNILIHHLNTPLTSRLCMSAIKSFRATHMRPNETSLVAILDFYTDMGYVYRFREWASLMRGADGRQGLMACAPWVTKLEASNGRLLRRLDDPDKLIQLPHPTPMVMTALMRGVLKFSGFDDVLSILEPMSREGWGIDIKGFGVLLEDCADRGDWTAGHAIWKEILKLHKKSRGTNRIGQTAFADMLRLCAQYSDKRAFGDVFQFASKCHSRNAEKIIGLVQSRSLAAKKGEAERQSQKDGPKIEPSSEDSLGSDRSEQPARHNPVHALNELVSQHIGNLESHCGKQAAGGDGEDLPTQEQLYGHVGGSDGLNDYESRERPMSQSGSEEQYQPL